MILQSSTTIQRVTILKKCDSKKVKVKFSEWENITNVPNPRQKHWILQYWDDLFILLSGDLTRMFMGFFVCFFA